MMICRTTGAPSGGQLKKKDLQHLPAVSLFFFGQNNNAIMLMPLD